MANAPDDRSIEILADILDRTRGTLKGINVKRYRIDHASDLDRIDDLANSHLLELDEHDESFRVGYMGLFFINNTTSKALFRDIDHVLEYLREQYRQNLDHPVSLTAISEALELERSRVEECVFYVQSTFSISVTTNLQDPEAYAVPSESLLRFGEIADFLGERARSWFPDAFATQTPKPHRNKERFASDREKVLGAAIAAITNWPEQCKRGESYNGKRIATVLDQKARLWWESGLAPMEIDTMARLINKHLKLPD